MAKMCLLWLILGRLGLVCLLPPCARRRIEHELLGQDAASPFGEADGSRIALHKKLGFVTGPVEESVDFGGRTVRARSQNRWILFAWL